MQTASVRSKSDGIWIAILTILAILGSALLGKIQTQMIVVFPIAFIAAIVLLSYPKVDFITSIIMLPLLSSKILSLQVLPISGAKINNMLLILILIGFLINKKMNFSEMKLPTFFYAVSIFLLIVAVLRANYVADYSMFFWKEPYTPGKFFVSHGIIPILTTIPLLFIIGTVRTSKQVHQIIVYLAYSMMFFSGIILFIFFTKVPFGSDFSTVRDIIGIENLGMHGNNIADFFIVAFPLIFSMAIFNHSNNRKVFIAAAVLSILAIMPLYSRTAYLMILVSIFMIIFMTRRLKLLIPVILGLVLIVAFVPSVTNRALSGIESKTANTITAGRTDEIWGQITSELQEEWKIRPEKILLGHGRYGVLSLEVFKNKRMLQVTHSHNMFLDSIVETGIIGLLFYLTFFGYVISKLSYRFIKAFRQNDNITAHLMAGLLIGLLCFLGRGLTDSFFLPQLTNSYAYLILGISFVAIRKPHSEERNEGLSGIK